MSIMTHQTTGALNRDDGVLEDKSSWLSVCGTSNDPIIERVSIGSGRDDRPPN